MTASSKPIILIVDDEPAIRAAVRFNFNTRLKGTFEYVDASSVAEAVALVEKLPIAVAILDIRMIGAESGFELPPMIRSLSPLTQCVFHSSHDDADSLINVIGNQALYVRKSTDPTDLISTVHKAYRQYLAARSSTDANNRVSRLEASVAMNAAVARACDRALSIDSLFAECTKALATWAQQPVSLYPVVNGTITKNGQQIEIPTIALKALEIRGFWSPADSHDFAGEQANAFWVNAEAGFVAYREGDAHSGVLLTLPKGVALDGEQITVLQDLIGQIKIAADRLLAIERATAAERRAWLSGLVSVVAHEVNSPLSRLQLFLAGAEMNDLEWFKARLPDQRKNIESIVATVNDLIEMKMSETPKLAPMPVGDMVQKAAVAASRHRPGVVHFDLPKTSLVILSSEKIIARIVSIFVNNALDATSDTPNPMVMVRVMPFSATNGATIVVSDNGPGMPDDMARGAFARVRTTKKTGHGIGLPLARMLADSIGGNVALLGRSELGGASFSLSLPLRPKD